MRKPDSKCVLVVEDDPLVRESVAEILELEGYWVEVAPDGQQALALVRTLKPEAIVLDLMMPVMDGWTFLKLSRADPLCNKPPVLVLSARSRLDERAKTLDVQAFLPKPFDLQVFVDAVDQLFELPVGPT